MSSHRSERLDNKFKNQLRCESCNKWTHVDHELWNEAKSNPMAVFLCDRVRCLRNRSETLIPAKGKFRVYEKNPY